MRYICGATLLDGCPSTSSDADTSAALSRWLCVAPYSVGMHGAVAIRAARAFPRALGGPFADPLSAGFHPPGSLEVRCRFNLRFNGVATLYHGRAGLSSNHVADGLFFSCFSHAGGMGTVLAPWGMTITRWSPKSSSFSSAVGSFTRVMPIWRRVSSGRVDMA